MAVVKLDEFRQLYGIALCLWLAGCYSIPEAPPFTGSTSGDDTGSDSENTTDTGPADGDTDTDGDADTDADTDGDADTDADADGDTDTDADIDTETETEQLTCADGLFCYHPPRKCDGDYSIVVYDPVGYCVDGANGPECKYEPVGSEPCEAMGSCNAGVCSETPCQGYVCGEPPRAACVEEHSALLFYTGLDGTCSYSNGDYDCDYHLYEIPCNNGCIDEDQVYEAMCQGEGSSFMVCDRPPVRYCDENGNARTFTIPPSPTCDSKGCYCDYRAKTLTECPGGCDLGRCVDE